MEREQAEWNMSGDYLRRLGFLLWSCDEAALMCESFRWFHTLKCLFRELSTEMTDTEIKEFNETTLRIHTEYSYEIAHNSGKSISEELSRELEQFEIKLRNVMKTSGILLKMKHDPAKALR